VVPRGICKLFVLFDSPSSSLSSPSRSPTVTDRARANVRHLARVVVAHRAPRRPSLSAFAFAFAFVPPRPRASRVVPATFARIDSIARETPALSSTLARPSRARRDARRTERARRSIGRRSRQRCHDRRRVVARALRCGAVSLATTRARDDRRSSRALACGSGVRRRAARGPRCAEAPGRSPRARV
jgi:hypothetical protein|tara:strand:+ start:3564 stop:4121 length:558 start_codon:yes stop_codon:yes gene_type:complete